MQFANLLLSFVHVMQGLWFVIQVGVKHLGAWSVVSNFFWEKLEIEMVIELQDAFHVENPKSKARLIIVHLQNSKDKWKIFGSTHKFKDLENEEGKLYQVFDQLNAKK